MSKGLEIEVVLGHGSDSSTLFVVYKKRRFFRKRLGELRSIDKVIAFAKAYELYDGEGLPFLLDH